MRKQMMVLCVLAGISWSGAFAAETTLPRMDQRFAVETTEVPDFQRHLLPMLSKIGCNGRSCHGSFQGRGGFQLSLFGYDFKMDHAGLKERIDTADPLESYALHKATNVEEHEGGERIVPGSWEHQVFVRWIEGGAKGAEQEFKLTGLEITPKEIPFARDGETQQLRAIAVWSDGTREDVTPLCRFQTNDASVAEVNADGLVTGTGKGDSHIVVFYDNGTVPVPVVRPVTDQVGDDYPNVQTSTVVDELVVQKLKKMGLVPSPLCSDEEFLRRVTLDLAGTLPTPREVEDFLADGSADKRTRLIDRLLETPAYSAWWATRLNDYTGNTANQLNNVGFSPDQPSQEWYEWIRARVAENVPYDQIVEGIVLAQSVLPGETYVEFCERMSEAHRDPTGTKFAEQDSMPYYWARRNFQKPEDRAIGFAYTFLGIRIQCAQCHKHPFDQWTQEDFKEFQPLFSTTRFSANGTSPKEYREVLATLEVDQELKGNQQRRELSQLLAKGKVVPFPALVQQAGPGPRQNVRKNSPGVQARMLGGEPFDMKQYSDPRVPLMDWLRGESRELFAKAFVNRVWGNYFHRGIVEPTDDLSLANPPVNAALLDYLTLGFLEHNFDMKWLHREICNSDTYQRSWQPNATNLLDERNFSRAIPRRVQAEVAYDALLQATAGEAKNAAFLTDLNKRAIAIPGSAQGRRGNNYALTIFGKSARENNCDCERSAEPTLLQTLFLFNDNEVLAAIDTRGGWLSEVSQAWQQPVKAEPSRNAPSKPESYDQIVQRYEQKLEQFKQDGNQERARQLRQRLIAYKAQYGQPAQETTEAPKPVRTAESDLRAAVTQAYLRTVSRYPTADEQTQALQAISAAETPTDGLRDVLWALLNTKEFILNH